MAVRRFAILLIFEGPGHELADSKSRHFFPVSFTEAAANKTILELLFSDYDKDVRPNQGGAYFRNY